MTEHRALVLTIPLAATAHTSGASLRVDDIVTALAVGGHQADVVQRVPDSGRWCTGVAVSYVSAGSLPALRARCGRTWLDAMDSWLLLNISGVRAGHPTYGARAVRDGLRLARSGAPDLVTWISGADRRRDGGTIRGLHRLVLPARLTPPVVQPSSGRRAVLAGDWAYPPNLSGLRWFVRRVLPHSSAVVDIFGPCSPAPQHPQLRVHGYVDDPGQLYTAGDVHVCPVRFGAGVKRKVLQPLLAGLPVVTTPAGAHGLRDHPLLKLCRTPETFASALDCLLGESVPDALSPPAAGDLLEADERTAVESWVSSCPG